MRILLAIWSLASENGGPTRSTIGLARALAELGQTVILFTNVPSCVPQATIQALQTKGVDFREGRGCGFLTALKDSKALLEEVKPDIVHIQGLWKLASHAMHVVAHRFGISVVISPRGMLDPWALSVKKWKKRCGMFLYQKHDLKHAVAFHATAEAEAEHIRDFGLKQSVWVVPNAVSCPKELPIANKEMDVKTAFFMSRLHPGKGLLLLADAWAKVKPTGWRMMVAGADSYGHKGEVVEKLKSLGIENDWTFAGELDDEQKWQALVNADLFIHPSASENFGISIAEALCAGIPVITTKGCPWLEIDGKCGWWIDRTIPHLADAMECAMALSDVERYAMGEQGKQLIQEKYTWPAVAKQMVAFYEHLRRRGGECSKE